MRVVTMLALVAVGGCTAIKATVHVAQAEQALGEARTYNAQDLAVYEYTMAVRYLEKSREELGSSDNRVCENLAKRSVEWSDKAIIAIERGRRGVDVLEEDLSDEARQAPPPVPLDEPLPDELEEPLDDLDSPAPAPTPQPAPTDDWDDDWEVEE